MQLPAAILKLMSEGNLFQAMDYCVSGSLCLLELNAASYPYMAFDLRRRITEACNNAIKKMYTVVYSNYKHTSLM